jgi:hypothetical protein
LQSEVGSGQKTIKSIAYYKASGTNLDPIVDVHIYMRHTTSTTATTGTVLASTTAPYTPVATGYQRVYSGNFPNDSLTGWMKVDLDSFFVYNGVDNLQSSLLKDSRIMSVVILYMLYSHLAALIDQIPIPRWHYAK